MAIEGEFSLLIERNDCLISRGIATPTPIPTPTPTPTPTPITKFFKECSFGQYGANHEFVGEASRSNDGPVNGAYVSAWIGNIEMVRTKSGTWGYLLLIPSCTDAREFNSEGAIIKFSIGGFWAEQTSILEGGSADILNLHQTNDPVVIN